MSSTHSLSAEDSHDQDQDPSQAKRKRPVGEGPRIQLACLPCRAKKAKCSGETPVCAQCQKANGLCSWPNGRRKKRTKKEMQEAAALGELPDGGGVIAFGGGGDVSTAGGRSGQRTSGSAAPSDAFAESENLRVSSAWVDPFLPNAADAGLPLYPPPSALDRLQQQRPPGTDYVISHPAPFPPSTTSHASCSSAATSSFPDLSHAIFQPPRSLSTSSSTYHDPDHQLLSSASSSTYPLIKPSPVPTRSTAITPSPHAHKSSAESSNHRARLAQDIADQVGYMEGDEGSQHLKLYYYRVSGSTAFHPGINRVCLKLQIRTPSQTLGPLIGNLPSFSSAPALRADSLSLPQRSPLEDVVFGEDDMAPESIYLPLIDSFFAILGQHFPSIQPDRIYGRLKTGMMSAFLCNAMCSVAARYSPIPTANPASAGNAFLIKAHSLLVPLLRFPTTDGVTGLLLLAWAEFGQNSDSGHWHFAGLAFRMAMDLGVHQNNEDNPLYEDHAHFVRTKHLFWSLFLTDRLLSLSTGRPSTIQESLIEIPLPEDEDIPFLARTSGSDSIPSLRSPFGWCVRLMVICGRVSDVLNGSRGTQRTFPDSNPSPLVLADAVKELQHTLVQHYSSVPSWMRWTSDMFKAHVEHQQGGLFLFYHMWANAVMSMLHHPDLLYSPNGSNTPITQGMDRSLQLSLASSRTIIECIVFADLCSPISYLGTPMIVQPLFLAGLAFVNETKQTELGMPHAGSGPAASTSDAFLKSLAQQNIVVLSKALRRVSNLWSGAGPVLNILEQRSSGLGHARVDFSTTSDHVQNTFVSLPDAGILRRFLPRNSGATQSATSHMPFSQHNLTSPPQYDESLSLDALLSQYDVSDFSVEPYQDFEPFVFDLD